MRRHQDRRGRPRRVPRVASLLMGPSSKEIPVYQALQMGVEMSLRLFDGQKSVVAFPFFDELFEFESFQCQVEEIRGTKAGITDATLAVVDKQAERADQTISFRGRESKAHFQCMSAPDHRR